MSLAAAAHHLASKGRNGDSMLIHMAPQEIAGLQALARAHGTKITTNPATGLPEAFSLKSLLPVLAGAFLGPAGVGLFGSAMTAGLGVGAATGLATGSLRKGLMAGLGAYGGAGLMGSIAGAGAQAAGAGAGAAAPGVAGVVPPVPAFDYAGIAGTPPIEGVVPQAVPAMSSGSPGMDRFIGADGFSSGPVQQSVVAPPSTPAVTQAVAQPVAQPAPIPDVASPMPGEDMSRAFPQQVGKLDQFKSGLGAIADKPSLLFNKDNLKYGLAAAAPMMLEEPKRSQYEGGGPNPYQYSYAANPTGASPGASRYEQEYFRPRYTRMAEGGSTTEADKYRYEYDPATQTYKPVVSETKATQAPSTRMLADPGMGPESPMTTVQGDPSHPLYGIMTPVANGIASLVNNVSGFFGGQPVIGAGGTSYVAGSDYMGSASHGVPSDYASSFGVAPGVDTPAGDGGSATGDPGTGVGGSEGDTTYARGGISHLGDYSDGGRLLRGPGDGVSDSIPASIANKRPARLADGEFVVPARIVSELGNGSTEAGARKLYAMMDRIQKARSKTVGKDKVAVNSRAEKLLPA